MKQLFFILTLLIICISSASAADVRTNVQKVQTATIYSVPAWQEPKGFVWEIISEIFDPVGKILSQYILAFQNIFNSDNNIPVWNATSKVFDESSITNLDNGFVWISNTNPEREFHVNGAGRFDNGVYVDEIRVISPSWASHIAQSSNVSRYGYFSAHNGAWERGAYFGVWNGWDRVNLFLDAADKLFISGWDVGIGNSNPQARLHVSGNVIASTPTLDNHLATKAYVDNQSSGTYFEDFIEQPQNLWEDSAVSTIYSANSPDTCNGNNTQRFICWVDTVKTCRDNYTRTGPSTPRYNREWEVIGTRPWPSTSHSEIITCARASYLVKSDYPESVNIKSTTWEFAITGRDYSGRNESCAIDFVVAWSPSCRVSRKRYDLWRSWTDSECIQRFKSDIVGWRICPNIKGVTSVVFQSNKRTVDIDYYGF